MTNTNNTFNIPFSLKTDTLGKTRAEVQHTLQIKGTRFRLGLCYVTADQECRREFGGPMVPGPYAATFGLATIVAGNRGSGAESARNKAAGTEHEVVDGDFLVIDGNTYQVSVYRREYIKLVPVANEVSPMEFFIANNC